MKEMTDQQFFDEIAPRPPTAWERIKQNPTLPVGATLTLGVVGTGLYYMIKGDQEKQNLLMRWRVAAQAITVGIIFFTVNPPRRRREDVMEKTFEEASTPSPSPTSH
eukprot:CAMPEP_0119134656 /NCGR_PEP_ID=MMETSP1310-20130426/17492_1 /TAXON_ID=464262 /ORGANISM="Genus nov. species nov., Strain RCC2339" /LENGTH=106 /DNA_ID=CAMNT_0007125477 /DNA_START=42 /DNA_END=362 /DNA_ORIENTATION=-